MSDDKACGLQQDIHPLCLQGARIPACGKVWSICRRICLLRSNGPTYIQSVELSVTPVQENVLLGREHVTNHIYNACAKKALKAVNRLRNKPEYMELARKKDKTKADKDELSRMRKDEGLTEFSMNMYAIEVLHHFPNSIDVHTAQNQARDALKAAEKVLYGKAKRLRFRPVDTPVTMFAKESSRGIILREKDWTVNWRGLRMPFRKPVSEFDAYQSACLADEVKYCGIRHEIIRGRNRWYVQIARKGTPPNAFRKHPDRIGEGSAGLDLGVSTAAVSSAACVKLCDLDPADRIYPPEGAHLSVKRSWREYHRPVDAGRRRAGLQRKMDRSRRANNPQNYNEDGTIRRLPKGEKREWHNSRAYEKTRAELREAFRKERIQRDLGHDILAKEIIALGDRFIAEPMSYKGLQMKAKTPSVNRKNGKANSQKRYGKTISNHAPGLLRMIMNRKLGYFGLGILEADPKKVKASQFNHLTGKCVKKQLYERWNDFDGRKVQRDLYSAFLLMCVTGSLDAVDIEECRARYGRFLELHDKEAGRLKKLPKGHRMRWYVR